MAQSSLAWYDQAALGAYRSVQSAGSVEQRVMAHVGMVKRIALHLLDRIGGDAELDELIQNGMVGLLEAAQRYDESEGVPFEAFALPRIRGSMVDQLRRSDWCPRTLRRQGQSIRQVVAAFEQREGRLPKDYEVASALELTVEEVRQIQARLETASLASLEGLHDIGVEPVSSQGDCVAEPLFAHRRQKQLSSLLKKLPEREQQILYLYYQEEMNLKEIAAVLGLTEARISQLRKKALEYLRKPMKEWLD